MGKREGGQIDFLKKIIILDANEDYSYKFFLNKKSK